MRKVYFENFDGIRTIAFLMVFVSHCWRNLYYRTPSGQLNQFLDKFFDIGSLGVNLFFVLSGFLITFLLVVEKNDTSNVDVYKFYYRRVLRIWPVYYLVVIVGVFILPNIIHSLKEEYANIQPINILRYALFMVNFDHINYGINFRWASVLWSVSVEEQFYLLWPLIIRCSNKKSLPIILFTLIIGSFAYRYINFESYRRVNYHTLACIGDLAFGALGALIVYYNSRTSNLFQAIPKPINIVIYISGVIILIYRNEIFSGQFLTPFIGLFGSLFFLYVLLEQTKNRNSIFKLENNRWLSSAGKYTYGLYCYHFFGIFAMNYFRSFFQINPKNFFFFLSASILALLISFFLSKISYAYFETPFLRLKEKYSYVVRS